MDTRVQITLNPQDREALGELAKKELREMRQQALHLVREGLAKKSENGEDGKTEAPAPR